MFWANRQSFIKQHRKWQSRIVIEITELVLRHFWDNTRNIQAMLHLLSEVRSRDKTLARGPAWLQLSLSIDDKGPFTNDVSQNFGIFDLISFLSLFGSTIQIHTTFLTPCPCPPPIICECFLIWSFQPLQNPFSKPCAWIQKHLNRKITLSTAVGGRRIMISQRGR